MEGLLPRLLRVFGLSRRHFKRRTTSMAKAPLYRLIKSPNRQRNDEDRTASSRQTRAFAQELLSELIVSA